MRESNIFLNEFNQKLSDWPDRMMSKNILFIDNLVNRPIVTDSAYRLLKRSIINDNVSKIAKRHCIQGLLLYQLTNIWIHVCIFPSSVQIPSWTFIYLFINSRYCPVFFFSSFVTFRRKIFLFIFFFWFCSIHFIKFLIKLCNVCSKASKASQKKPIKVAPPKYNSGIKATSFHNIVIEKLE